jgi:hypothetical protein
MARPHKLSFDSRVAGRVRVMSGSGLKNLSLMLLVALVAYVAWSGGA